MVFGLGTKSLVLFLSFLSARSFAFEMSCEKLARSYSESPLIQTQTVPNTCGPVCVSNAVHASAKALDLVFPPEVEKQIAFQTERLIPGPTPLGSLLTALQKIYASWEQVEASIDAFTIFHSELQTAQRKEVRLLREVTAYDLLDQNSDFEVSYTVLGVSFHEGRQFYGNHSFLLFGFTGENLLMADPRGGNGTFVASVGRREMELPSFSNRVSVPALFPLERPPVYSRVPGSAEASVLNGVRVRLRRKASDSGRP